MAFFGAAIAALKTLKSNQVDGKPPVDNSHKHSGGGDKASTSMSAGSIIGTAVQNTGDQGTIAGPETPRSGGRPENSFMGKGQVDQFSSLTDPLSVDRGGRTIAREDNSTSLDPVGIKPAMNPPLATPTDNIDEQGVNSLY